MQECGRSCTILNLFVMTNNYICVKIDHMLYDNSRFLIFSVQSLIKNDFNKTTKKPTMLKNV